MSTSRAVSKLYMNKNFPISELLLRNLTLSALVSGAARIKETADRANMLAARRTQSTMTTADGKQGQRMTTGDLLEESSAFTSFFLRSCGGSQYVFCCRDHHHRCNPTASASRPRQPLKPWSRGYLSTARFLAKAQDHSAV